MAFKVTNRDWLSDIALRSCSLASRALWVSMRFLEESSPQRGRLLTVTGAAITPEQLARIAGTTMEEVVPLLEELIAAGICEVLPVGIISICKLVPATPMHLGGPTG